ncbi:hypothetical protein [Pelodictyon luteolum]|uniref:hypothetical protein n=1 Tax=Pelodictyon luteolum TaxID=1100 RepID=UPI000316230D|nr:hypothetical protein [Pelodictyon luteolum]
MKKICRLEEKDALRHAGRVAEEGGARHICRRCARVARKKDALCKPQKIKRDKQKGRH